MPRESSRSGQITLVALALVAILSGCRSNDGPVVPTPNTNLHQYWVLTLDHHAVTMSTTAPYDTFRLTATPRDANGTPLAGPIAPTFTSSDIKDVQVDSTGLVHALGTVAEVTVTATLLSGGVTHADTAYIGVTSLANPPVLRSLSIHPVPPDSAETSIDNGTTLPFTALDTAGDTLSGLIVYYQSLNVSTATIDPTAGLVTGVYPGRVTFVATATAYGITKADTLPFVIGWPSQAFILITQQFVSGKAVLGFGGKRLVSPGATVVWRNASTTTSIDIVFDDSAAVDSSPDWCTPDFQSFPWLCQSGNVPPFAQSPDTTLGLAGYFQGWAIRSFPKPGTYHYHSKIFGTEGEIDVIDWHTL